MVVAKLLSLDTSTWSVNKILRLFLTEIAEDDIIITVLFRKGQMLTRTHYVIRKTKLSKVLSELKHFFFKFW